MTPGDFLTILFVALGGVGTFLLLPHRHGATTPRRLHLAGAISAGLAILGFRLAWTLPGEFIPAVFFYIFSVCALVAGLLTVTSRDPVHSALWFACVVLSSSGLFVLAGAQFVAAGTIIVYAGAIIVTFLFVIMLAQMEGRADYDRAARSPGLATFTCSLLLWCLIYSLGALQIDPKVPQTGDRVTTLMGQRALQRTRDVLPNYKIPEVSVITRVMNLATPATSRTRNPDGSTKPIIAGLGESLYSDHLITVGFSGILLFAALIAAVAITNPKRPPVIGGTTPPDAGPA